MLIKDVGFIFSSNILSLFFGILSSILVARVLGPEGRGLFGLALLIPSILATFCIFGQNTVNTVYAGLDKDRRSQLLWQTFFYSLAAVGISFAVIFIFFRLPIQRGLFDNLSPKVIWLSCFYAPAMILSMLMLSLVRGTGKIQTSAILNITSKVFLLCLIIVFLLIFKFKLNALILIHISSFLLVTLLAIWILRQYLSIDFRKFSFPFFKKTLSFGFWVNLTTVATFLLYKFDQGMLGYMVTAEEIGLYIVAVSLAEQLRILPSSISAAYLPRLANDKAARQGQVPEIFRYTTIVSTTSMILIGLLGIPGIYILYGKAYTGSIVSFLLLIPGIAALGGASILSGDLSVREKPKYGVLIAFSSLILNVVLNFLMIPYLGIAGAALASSICYILAFGLWIVFYIRESKAKAADLWPRISDFKFLLDQGKQVIRQLAARYLPAKS